jgi:hypothetical protein
MRRHWTHNQDLEAHDSAVASSARWVGRLAAAVNNLAPISQLLVEWRHTAEIYADPELYAILTAAHEGDHGPVPEPIA